MIRQRDYSTLYIQQTVAYTRLYTASSVSDLQFPCHRQQARDLSVQMRRMNSYLRSTIGDERLSNLSLMHIHKHVQVNLDMILEDIS